MKKENTAVSRKGKISIGVGIGIVAVAVGLTLFFLLKPDKGFRTIKIYDIKGTATVEREESGKMDAYENLLLQNKDKLEVASASSARLKMDEDKYAVVEENTKLDILAEGDSENSLTELVVETGNVTTDIENKLSADSSYKVSTPNSVMAVRGTIFMVDVSKAEDGTPTTNLKVLRGKVGFAPKDESGNVLEEIPVEAGRELSMTGNEEPVVQALTDFTNPFDEETKAPSDDPAATGAESPAPSEAAESAPDADQAEDSLAEKEDTDTEDAGNEDEDDTEDADDGDIDDGDDADADESAEEPGDTSDNEKSSDKKKTTSDKDKKKTTPKATKPPKPKKTKKPKETHEPAIPVSPSYTAQPPAGVNTEAPSAPIVQGPTLTPAPTAEVPVEMCTVTFRYKGNVFATKRVEKGSKVTQPLLAPAPEGRWDYDFSKPVMGNIAIDFVD